MAFKTVACEVFSAYHLLSSSRVPNAEVLRRACYPAATDMLLKRQLLLFGKVLRSAYDHPLHNSAFIRGTLQPATSMYVRRVGRPRREWVTFVRDKACQFLKSHREITRLVQNPHVWNHTVCQFYLSTRRPAYDRLNAE